MAATQERQREDAAQLAKIRKGRLCLGGAASAASVMGQLYPAFRGGLSKEESRAYPGVLDFAWADDDQTVRRLLAGDIEAAVL